MRTNSTNEHGTTQRKLRTRTPPSAALSITTRVFKPRHWPILEKLFGPNGACGGCWCMWWRIGPDDSWPKVKGRRAKERMHELAAAGEVQGVLAFDGTTPIGWATFGPRPSFSRPDRAPSLACADADNVWSVPCFYIRAGYRGRGVATALLDASLREMKRLGAKTAEGYPVRATKPGQAIPAAFAWTGTEPLFAKAGFKAAAKKARGKQRVRKSL